MLNTFVFRCWPQGQINEAALSRIQYLRSRLQGSSSVSDSLIGDLQALMEEWQIPAK